MLSTRKIYDFYKSKWFIITVLFFISTAAVIAQPVVTLKAASGNCISNGSIQVTAANTQGTVLYQLVDPSPVTTVTQASNTFSNLPSGTYTIAVYDNVASATPVKKTITLTNYYTPLDLNASSASISSGVKCGPNGAIIASVKSGTGTSPFTYALSAGPITRPPQSSASFVYLPAGNYTVTVTDACGSSKSNSVNVNNGIDYSNVIFNSFSSATFNFSRGAACNNVTITQANVSVQNAQGSTYSVSSNSFMTRVEFPAGSGNYTAWNSATSYNIDVTGQSTPYTFVLQVQHPCSGAILSTATITIPMSDYIFTLPSSGNMCGTSNRGINVSNQSVNALQPCNPITLELTNKATPDVTKTYTYNNSINIPPADLDSLATYTFKFKDNMGVQTSKDFKYSPTLIPGGTSLTWNGMQHCSSTGTDVRLNGFLSAGPYPVKISIISGPGTTTSLPPVLVTSYTGANGLIYYQDLPAGNYQFKVEYGSCKTETKSWTINPVYSDFKFTTTTVTAGASGCGYYNVALANSYKAGTNTIQSFTALRFKIIDGPASVIGQTGTSNSFANLGPGTYTVGAFLVKDPAATLLCDAPLATTTFTLVPYGIPVVDLKQSGGVICDGGTTANLHVEASGLGPLQYRVKKKTDPDTSYSAYQLSPDFAGLAAGDYTVQIKDACSTPSIATQNISIINASGAQALVINNAHPSGKICKGSTIQLVVKPVGPIATIEWFFNGAPLTNGLNSDMDTVEVSNFAAANEGTYLVKITYLSGCEMNSQQVLNLAPNALNSNIQADDVTICIASTAKLTASSSTIADSPVFRWYSDAALTNLVFTGTTYVTNVLAATTQYYVTVSSGTYCENLPAEAKIVTVTYDDACVCYKPAVTTGTAEPIKTIMSTLDRSVVPRNWSDPRAGSLILESKTRGLVLTRIASPETAITSPVEGMIVYDTVNNVLKFYNGTIWKVLVQSCPDY
jgi:hypothetical protein